MPEMQVSQGEFWNDPAERLADGFTLKKPKGARTLTATCEVWTNPFGWELRLMLEGHLLMESVVRSAPEMAQVIEQWKAAMREHGWN